MKRLFCTVLLAHIAILSGCTWVALTPEGEKVSVSAAGAVEKCEHLGKVTASVKNRVSGVERKPGKVAEELARLARNEAGLMKGDTIVAESDVSEGRQVFGVYRCGD